MCIPVRGTNSNSVKFCMHDAHARIHTTARAHTRARTHTSTHTSTRTSADRLKWWTHSPYSEKAGARKAQRRGFWFCVGSQIDAEKQTCIPEITKRRRCVHPQPPRLNTGHSARTGTHVLRSRPSRVHWRRPCSMHTRVGMQRQAWALLMKTADASDASTPRAGWPHLAQVQLGTPFDHILFFGIVVKGQDHPRHRPAGQRACGRRARSVANAEDARLLHPALSRPSRSPPARPRTAGGERGRGAQARPRRRRAGARHAADVPPPPQGRDRRPRARGSRA